MSKMRKVMLRAISNGAVAFFTVLGAVNLAGIESQHVIYAAIAGAFIQGSLVASQEFKHLIDIECEQVAKGKRPPLPPVGNALLLF